MTKSTLILIPTLGLRSSLSETIRSAKSLQHNLNADIYLVGKPSALLPWVAGISSVKIFDTTSAAQGIFPELSYAFKVLSPGYSFFCYINDDDMFLPSFVSLFKSLDNADLDTPFSYGLTRRSLPNGFNYIQGSFPIPGVFPQLVSAGIPFITQQSVLFRVAAINNITSSLFDPKYNLVADSHLLVHLIKGAKSSPIFVRRVCSVYSKHEQQLTADKTRLAYESSQLSKSINTTSTIKILLILAYRIYNLQLYLGRLVRCTRSRLSK